ncbi:MAG: hypothetical protein AEth_01516 [Candidatus Argoarchaeum ethanivorans]|uniref:Uncharacterized protein n=1 Tax=Candidatus Argoarchaeum ethanivorans TaxID=2608793 RepID=A0A8B3S084_9EURY|nr:MAG: hypothetical protein AEth_01516 [Candidatus Argoarchaeum ethanivorans]
MGGKSKKLGVNLNNSQGTEIGHVWNYKKTEIYVHVNNKTIGKIINPLDTLDFKETKR